MLLTRNSIRILCITVATLAANLLFADKIAVVDFEDRTNQIKEEVLQGSKDYLIQTLKATGKYEVIPNDVVQKAKSSRKDWAKCFSLDCQTALGSDLKADTIVSSSIDFFAGIHTLTINFVTVKTKIKTEAGASDFNGTAVGMKSALDAVVATLQGKKVNKVETVQQSEQNQSLEKYQKTNYDALPPLQYIVPVMKEEKKKEERKPIGNVSFTSSLAGVKVIMDKATANEKTCNAPCTLNNLPAGDHFARFEKAGYNANEEVVTINDGKTTKKAINLTIVVADKSRVNNDLIEASKQGDIDGIKKFLKEGADVNYHNPQGLSPALVATFSGHRNVTELLLARGAKFTDVEAGTLLLISAETNDVALLNILIKQKVNLNFKYDNGRTILWTAVEKESWAVLEALIKAKVDIDSRDFSGNTVLKWTIVHGLEKAAEILAKNGIKLQKEDASRMLREAVSSENIVKLGMLTNHKIDFNEVYEDGLTPLWYAAVKGRTDMVEVLLKAGANADIKDNKKKSLIMYAIENRKLDIATLLTGANAKLSLEEQVFLLQKGMVIGDYELVKVVVRAGANVNMKFDDGLSALWIAAFNNNKDMINVLASSGANLNIKDNSGKSVLIWAVENNRKELANLLISLGANVNLFDNDKRTALYSAVQAEKLPLVEMLVKNKAQIDLKDKNGDSPLIVAVAKGNMDIVRFLIDNGAMPNTQDKNGNSPLMVALYKGYNDIVTLLTDKNADVNKENSEKKTPLIVASMRGEKPLVDLFIKKGAELDKQDSSGLTALMYAKKDNRKDIVHLLLSKNARIYSRAETDELMAYACDNNYGDIVELMIGRKVDVNRRFADGLTPLFYASRNGNESLIKMLAAAGADLESRDKEGNTPLLYAGTKREENVVIMLINLGADVNVKDKKMNTPLHLAASRGHGKAIELMIQKKARLNEKDENGRSPMTRAKFTGNYDIVDLLKRAGADEE